MRVSLALAVLCGAALLALHLPCMHAAPVRTEEAAAAAADHHADAPHDEVHHDANATANATDEAQEFFPEEDVSWDEYQDAPEDAKERDEAFDDEYERYLREMEQQMLDNKELHKDLLDELERLHVEGNPTDEDTRLLQLARVIQERHEVRSQMEEQERQAIENQREMIRKEQEHELDVPSEDGLPEEPVGIEESEHDRVMAERRKKLIDSIADEKHRAFLEHQMEAELQFREELSKEADPDKRRKMQEEHNRRLQDAQKLRGHHPGSQQQLEQVWKEEDGLQDNTFNPVVFFRLHDTTEDGHWDPMEVEAIVMHEAKSLHPGEGAEVEFAIVEEASRMRNHIIDEADKNKDGLISITEFTDLTKRPDFASDPAWAAVTPNYTEEQLKAYEKRRNSARESDKAWRLANGHVDPNVVEALLHARNDSALKERLRQMLHPAGEFPHTPSADEKAGHAADPAHHDKPAAGHAEQPAAHVEPAHPAAPAQPAAGHADPAHPAAPAQPAAPAADPAHPAAAAQPAAPAADPAHPAAAAQPAAGHADPAHPAAPAQPAAPAADPAHPAQPAAPAQPAH